MNIYDSLLGAVHSEYDVLMLIKRQRHPLYFPAFLWKQ